MCTRQKWMCVRSNVRKVTFVNATTSYVCCTHAVDCRVYFKVNVPKGKLTEAFFVHTCWTRPQGLGDFKSLPCEAYPKNSRRNGLRRARPGLGPHSVCIHAPSDLNFEDMARTGPPRDYRSLKWPVATYAPTVGHT